jgi:hypothetical protein
MNRSAVVTASAVLSLIGSVLMLLVGVLMAAAMFFAPPPETSEFPVSPVFFKAIFLILSLMFLLPAIWGIISSIGLFLLKNWARISMIVFSVLLILVSGSQLLGALIISLPFGAKYPIDDNSMMVVMRIVMAAFATVHLGIGIWWLAYFTRPKVVQQFKRAPLMAAAETSLPMTQQIQVSAAPATLMSVNKRPVSVTVIAWFMLAGCLFMPLNFVLHPPAILATKILTGWPAMLVYLIYIAAALYCGVGLLRLKPAARLATIGYFIVGAVNQTIFYFAPGGGDRIRALMDWQQSMFSWIPAWQDQPFLHFDPTPFLIMGTLFGLILLAVPLYFLITRKEAFLAAAAELKASKTA